jgi:hypothetical protein
MIPTRTPDQLAAELSAPFAPEELRWRPRNVSGSRALALPYVNAAAIIARLNAVLGLDGWKDAYWLQANGSVVCQLRIRVGDHWMSRQDVGSPSQQDATKGAYSDALKRAARKYGIGLYLTILGGQWLDYDPKTKQIVGKPQLPAWAVPKKGKHDLSQVSSDLPNGDPAPHTMPATGQELEQRLAAYDDRLSQEGVIMGGDLLAAVSHVLAEKGFGLDTRKWGPEAIRLAVDETKAFEAKVRAKQQRKDSTARRMSGKEARHA